MIEDAGASPKITVAISGMSVAATLAPGMPVARALHSAPEFRGRLVGFSYDPLDPPSYDAELLSHSFLFPFPMYGPERLLARLTEIHARVPLTAIIPTLDSELANYIQIESQLRAMGIGIILPSAEAFNLRSKTELPGIAERTGLRVPHSMPADSLAEALQVSQEFDYPFVVKGNLHGATVIHTGNQLAPAVEQHASRWGYPVVLQEYVPGVEYDVAALGDGHGELLGAVPMKKLQIDDRGKAWGGDHGGRSGARGGGAAGRPRPALGRPAGARAHAQRRQRGALPHRDEPALPGVDPPGGSGGPEPAVEPPADGAG